MIADADVPSGWEVVSLDELFDFSNGVNADKSAYGVGVPFASVLEVITNEALTDRLIPGRINLSPTLVARYQVRHGDVLFNRTSETQEEVGLASVYVGRSMIVFGGFVFRGRPKTRRLDVGYSQYALRAYSVREQITAYGQGGIRANIGQRDLKSVQVIIPTVTEQRRVAEVLADIDRQIGALKRLLVKRQAIQRGMLQWLCRARAVSGSSAALGSVTAWLSGGTPDRTNTSYWSGNIPWISATTLKDLEVNSSNQGLTAAGVKAGSQMAPVGATLLLVRGSALHSEIRASLVTAPVCFNQDVKALIPSKCVIPKFLTYSIHSNADGLLRLVTSAGNTAGVLDTSVVKGLSIWMPDKTEQLRVVKILDDVSTETKSLRKRLAKAKAIKQGMMQELLTGRTRLPMAEIATA
jgi:type I restriction enzyme, S subunit